MAQSRVANNSQALRHWRNHIRLYNSSVIVIIIVGPFYFSFVFLLFTTCHCCVATETLVFAGVSLCSCEIVNRWLLLSFTTAMWRSTIIDFQCNNFYIITTMTDLDTGSDGILGTLSDCLWSCAWPWPVVCSSGWKSTTASSCGPLTTRPPDAILSGSNTISATTSATSLSLSQPKTTFSDPKFSFWSVWYFDFYQL